MIEKHLGVLLVEGQALSELMLQAYYLLSGRSSFMVGERLLCCLADFQNFHYFKLDVPTTLFPWCNCIMCDIVCDAECNTVFNNHHWYWSATGMYPASTHLRPKSIGCIYKLWLMSWVPFKRWAVYRCCLSCSVRKVPMT